MSKKNQLKSGVIMSYLNLVVGNVIALFYTPFMLQCLGQAEYGTYSVVNSIVSYLTIFDLGFSNVIVRYGAQYKEEGEHQKEKKLYGSFLIIYFVIGIVVLLLGLFLSQNLNVFDGKFQENELRTAEVLMIMGVVNIAVSFPMGIFRAILTVNEEFFTLRILDFLRTILTPVSVIFLLLLGYKAVALMAVNVILNVGVMIAHMVLCFVHLKTELQLGWFEKNIFVEIMSYSFLVTLGMIIDKIYWSTDQIILAAISGPEKVAVYTIGSTFPSYFISFSLAVSNVLLPRITTIASSDVAEVLRSKQLSDMFLKVGRIQFWILALILSGFILWGKEFIVNLWAGKGYEDAYYIALIIMVPSMVSLTQNTGISILQARKKLAFRSYSYLFIAILNIVISIPLAREYGGIGCAVGTSIGTVLGPIVCMNVYYWKKIEIDIPAYWKNFIKMTLVLFLPILCGLVIKSKIEIVSYWDLFLAAGLYVMVYLTMVYLIGLNSEEKIQFKQMILRKRNRGRND